MAHFPLLKEVSVKRQLRDLSSKVRKIIQPVFTSRKLKQDLSLREPKPNIVSQQCVVYFFKCDLCDAGYVGYTKVHLYKRVEGHRQKASSIYKHYSNEHNTAIPDNFLARFNVRTNFTVLLMKCCVFKILNQHSMYSLILFVLKYSCK